MTAKLSPHPFREDPDLPADVNGRRVCRCGLVGRPGDAHHEMPDVPHDDAQRRAAGEKEDA